MRNNKMQMFYVLSLLLLMFAWNNVSAQCGNCTTDGPLNSLSYARPAYAPDWTTVQSNSVEGRDYMLFNVVKGQIYRWTTYGPEDDSIGLDQACTDDGDCVTGLTCEGLAGSKTCELGFDTQLTLLKGTCSNSGEVLAYNRNALFRNQSMIEWKADFNGTVFLLVNNYDCATSCDIDGLNCMATSVKWQRKDSSYCSDCSYSYPTTTDPPGTPASPFVSPVDAPGWTLTANNDIKAGEFQTFAVDKGKIYRWSTCSDESFDTQLTLYRGIASTGSCGQFLNYSDDSPNEGACPDGTKQTVLEWLSDFDGYVTVLLNQYNCAICYDSQNPTDPYGHCEVSSLEWQRYDCNECNSYAGTDTPTSTLKTKYNLDHGDYMKFNLVKGGQYVFRSVEEDTSTTFTGLLTLRKNAGSACYGETLMQSNPVSGSHVQEIVFTPLETMTVELLVSGYDCTAPTGKHADITYQMVYDPDERFSEYEDSNNDVWTGTVFDSETQTVYLDNNVSKENWADAIQYCEDFVYNIPGGGTVDGWSLPNINQLYSVVDFNLFDPATSADWVSYVTDTSGEGGSCTQSTQETDCTYPKYICSEDELCARNNWYWSSTTVYGTEEFAWGVNMKDGRSYRALKYDYDGTNSTSYRVICVTGVSIFGELDALRPAEERIFSGWACDKKDVNDKVKIYFELFYSKDPVNHPGSVASVLDAWNWGLNSGTIITWGHYGWEYGNTDLFPASGSAKEFKIDSNCGSTAQTTEHAYELDFNDTSNSIVKKMRAVISSDSKYKPPYYVTAWAEELGMGSNKKELVPQREIFVINDICGDNHITGTEMCDEGNTVTEECAYNTSCIVCDSTCNLVAGYSPHCGDSTMDSPDENCDCGPGYYTMDGSDCDQSITSKRCPGYTTGTGTCVICNEICQQEILSVPHCGDAFTDTPEEACDDGNGSNSDYCLTNCQFNVCSDGYVLSTGCSGSDCEFCDDGAKNGHYETECDGFCCNSDCSGYGPHCGDGIIQREDCTGYASCVEVPGANEICDNAGDNGKWLTLSEHAADVGCNSTCTGPAPFCGDGIQQEGYEYCDDGAANEDDVYGKCQTDCQSKPRCGDGILDGTGGTGIVSGGEDCDDGLMNGEYGYCNKTCNGLVGCGDATTIGQEAYEECDVGEGNFIDWAANKDNSCCYTGTGDCTANCVYGRYCGDAVVDNGRDYSVATDLYYKFDEKTGSSVSDSSGNGNDGQVFNVVRVFGAEGLSGRGIFIDDSSHPSLERATGPAVAAATNLTLEAWIFPMKYSADYATIILGSGAYYLSLYSNGSLRAYWYGKSPAGYHSTAAGTVPLKTWSHVAAVWNSTELKLYINGVLKKTVAVTGTGNPSTSTIIGAQNEARQFEGLIDEVAISGRALTVDEIFIHYNGKNGAEYCDDGDADNGNGNVPVGTAILDYETTCSDACHYFHFCGDGKIDGPGGNGLTSGPEICDDGLPGNFGEYGRCNPGCMELGPHCGDGEKNGPEQCDKAPANSDNPGTVWDGSNDASATCRSDCTWARCGDGIQDTGEECDDGLNNSDTEPGACRTNCTVSRCGDSVADPDEQCDDGNTVDYDSCTNLCKDARCGDGIRKTIDSSTGDYDMIPNEECDDGNLQNGDYCDDQCKVSGSCGDGKIQVNIENCDNADPAVGDGEGKGSAYCTGSCTGSGTTMTCQPGCTVDHGACGDSDIDYVAGEICEDGNPSGDDYCAPDCKSIMGSCGDGAIQNDVENCDSADPSVDPYQGVGTYCVNNCQTVLGVCGDGKIQGPGYNEDVYGGVLPTGSGWTFQGPEDCDTFDSRVTSLGSSSNIGCNSCQRAGFCGDGIRQLRFEGCDTAGDMSPILILDMNETSGTMAYDSSGNGHNATLYKGPVWTSGKYDNGLSLDGLDDYVSAGYIGTPTEYTAMAWVKIDSLSKSGDANTFGQTIMATSSGYALWLSVGKGGSSEVTLRAFSSSSAGHTTSGANLNTTDWFHIAVTAVKGSTAKVYVNGVEKLSFTADNTAWAGNLTIGDLRPDRGIRFGGTVDDVRIFDRALTSTEILYMQSSLDLRMDENSGTTTNDNSNNGYDATLYNGTTWTNGKSGSALKFDGANDYAKITDNIVSNPSELTMAAWIRRDGNGSTYECAIHKGSNTSIGASEYWLGVDINNYLTATIGARVSGIGWDKGKTTTVAAVGTWYHLAAVWDGSVVKVYVNGTYNKQYALTSYSNLTTPVRFGASSDGANYQFNGSLDNVIFIERALSPTEVVKVMNGEATGCHLGCMSDPKGNLDFVDRTVIKGWACDPDHPMSQNTVKLVFTDATNATIDTKEFDTSYSSEQAVQKICGGGSNHRWQFDPNDGSINWVAFTQPFTVKAYSVTPDGSPESDVLIGFEEFTMSDICGDGIHEGAEECDDGNSINTDNCRTDCKLPSCGDELLSTGATGIYAEVCEQGNTTTCELAGVTGGVETDIQCKSDCKGWLTEPINISTGQFRCTKTWTCNPPEDSHPYEVMTSVNPSSYSQGWTGTAWLPVDDPVTEYNPTYSATSCRYKCGSNFSWNGSQCVGSTQTQTCSAITTNPTGKVAHTPTTYTQTWTLVGASWQWDPETDYVNNYEEVQVTPCSYYCGSAYHYNPGASSGPSDDTCDSNVVTYSCSGLPSHAQWNMGTNNGSYTRVWNSGSEIYEPAATSAVYNEIPKSDECRFICQTGYYYNQFTNQCVSGYCGDSSTNIMATDLDGSTRKGDHYGNATATNYEVTLTPAATGQYGIYQYNGYDFGKSFVVAFDMYIGDGTGADALYFYAHNTNSPYSEEQATGGYIVAFDEYQDKVMVKWDGTLVTEVARSYIDNSKWKRGRISFSQRTDGKTEIKVFINQALVIDHVDSARSKTGALFGFGARTGGSYNLHKIKNVEISREICDDGTNNGGYGSCSSDCMGFGPGCGDGATSGAEECDWGDNNYLDEYNTVQRCNYNCQWNDYCGDSTRQSTYEKCDKAISYTQDQLCSIKQGVTRDYYNDSSASCDSDCKGISGTCKWCGDGAVTNSEPCDYGLSYNSTAGTLELCNEKLGLSRSSYYAPSTRPSCSSSCGIVNATKGTNCKWCGDYYQTDGEECDTTSTTVCYKSYECDNDTCYRYYYRDCTSCSWATRSSYFSSGNSGTNGYSSCP